MSNDLEPLDPSGLKAVLEGFVVDVMATSSLEDADVLRRARSLLERLRDWPATADSQESISQEWQGLRIRTESEDLMVSCWREQTGQEVVVHGEWIGSAIERAYLGIGERHWAAPNTPEGGSPIETDPSWAALAAEPAFGDVAQRMERRGSNGPRSRRLLRGLRRLDPRPEWTWTS